jgi:hypothetical protein
MILSYLLKMNVEDIKQYLIEPLNLDFSDLLNVPISSKNINLKKFTDDVNVFLFRINNLKKILDLPDYENDEFSLDKSITLSNEAEHISLELSSFLTDSFISKDNKNFVIKNRMNNFAYDFIMDFETNKKRFAFEEILDLFDEKVIEFPSKLMIKYYSDFSFPSLKIFENEYNEILMKMINHKDVILQIENDIREHANALAIKEEKDANCVIADYLKSFNEHFVASIKIQNLLC